MGLFKTLVFILGLLLGCHAFSLQGQRAIEHHTPRLHVVYFDLPTQSLATGLVEFALQSNLTLLVQRELVEKYRSSPVIGHHDPEVALGLLLAKSPLSYTYNPDLSAFVIAPGEPAPTPLAVDKNAAEPTLQSVVEEVHVSAVRYPFRYTSITSSQSHGDINSFDTGRFLNTVPGELIVDQQANSLFDVLRNISGITPGDGLANTNDDYYVRGFQRHATYLDGFRLDENTGVKIHPSHIERVEILKGPSTLLYGQAEPGGVVNVVKKKPRTDGKKHVSVAGGSGAMFQASADLNGDFFTDNVNYRFIYAADRYDQLLEASDVRDELVSTSLRWNINHSTTLDFSVDRQQASQVLNQGTVIVTPIGSEIGLVALDEPAEQARPDFNADSTLVNLGYAQVLGDSWYIQTSYTRHDEKRFGIRAKRDALLNDNIIASVENVSPDTTFIIIGGIVIPINQGTDISGTEEQLLNIATISSLYDETSELSTDAFRLKAEGVSNFFKKEHRLTLGLDVYRRELDEIYTLLERQDIESLDFGEDDISNDPTTVIDVIINSDSTTQNFVENRQGLSYTDFGFFAQDNIAWTSYFSSSVGLRYTRTEGERIVESEASLNALPVFEELSADFALVLSPRDYLNIYTNYSQSMKPNYQIDDIGTVIDLPELSDQVELGFKSMLFDGRLIGTAGLFKIRKENIVNVQFLDGQRTAVLGDELHSIGMDVDFTFQINQQINLIGAFAVNNTEFVSGVYEGNRPALTSNETASVYLNYHIPQVNLGELRFGMGGYFVGERYSELENNALLDAYTTVDLGLSYAISRYTVQLNAQNIFNEDYIASVEPDLRVVSGRGRTVILSLGVRL